MRLVHIKKESDLLMALIKIRGEQIQAEALTNAHIAANAAIDESKINVDWAVHYSNALAIKKLLDYVQKNGIAVEAAVSSIDNIIDAANPKADDNGTDLGVIVTDNDLKDKNKVIVRNNVTGEPVDDGAGGEVFGRVTWDAALNDAAGGFKLSFYKSDETVYTFATAETVDIQYIQRFNLRDVDEAFSMNEKFVDGAADITAHLNIEQLAIDLYGEAALDRDGQGNGVGVKGSSVKDQLNNLYVTDDAAKGAKLIGVLADGVIAKNVADAIVELNGGLDAEATARTNANTAIVNDLASTETAKGASLVGVEDIAGKFTATTVEGVLTELQTNIETTSSSGGTALTGFEADLADTVDPTKGANMVGVYDIDNKLTAIDVNGALIELADQVTLNAGNLVDEIELLAGVGGATQIGIEDIGDYFASTTIEAALQEVGLDSASQDGRLGTLEARDHTHVKKVAVVTTDMIATGEVSIPDAATFDNTADLDVFVNGILQVETTHYTPDTVNKNKVVFGADVLVAGDLVIFKFLNNSL